MHGDTLPSFHILVLLGTNHPHLSQLKIQITFHQNPFCLHKFHLYLHLKTCENPQKLWHVPPEKCSQRSLLVKSMRPFKAFTAWSVSLVILALDSFNMMGKIAVGEDAVGLSSSFVDVLLFYGEPYVKMLWKESQKASHP